MSAAAHPQRHGGEADAGQMGAALQLLCTGDVTLKGRVAWSSNATFLVEVTSGSGAKAASTLAIYKPEQGERPLWDFEPGLWRREVAAYELSAHLGWDVVPPTVTREDAPLGEGSLQLFIEHDPDEHYFSLVEERRLHAQLRRMAAFDVVANNADRKGGHCLLGPGGHIWGIDHGLTFHRHPKLRTVIWDFAGTPLDEELVGPLSALADADVPAAVAELLPPEEVMAMVRRAGALARKKRLPQPTGEFPYPWPLV